MIEFITNYLPEILSGLSTLFLSVITLCIVWVKTKTKSIESKVESCVIHNLSHYYIVINGVKYNLSQVQIYKEVNENVQEDA